MKGTEQSSSPTYPFQGHPSHHLSTPPLQVHEEDRQGGRRGTLGGVGGGGSSGNREGGRRVEGIVPVCSLFLDIESSGHIAVTSEDIRA